MTDRRVLYVIDHQRPGRDRWSKRSGISSAPVSATGDAAAQEIAERHWLTEAPVVREGCRIRVRVWPEPADYLAFEPDDQPGEGTWIYDLQSA